MDARKMRKVILYEALFEHEAGLFLKESNGTLLEDIGHAIDRDGPATKAQIARYRRVLQQMVEEAEAKI
jgi:hypothetical protein